MPPETWHVAYAAGQRRKISIAIALHFAACRIPTTAIERDAGLIPARHDTRRFVGRMNVVRLTGVSQLRRQRTAATRRGADLCAVHASGIAGEHDVDTPDPGVNLTPSRPKAEWVALRCPQLAGRRTASVVQRIPCRVNLELSSADR
jgi:hypothetical protein